MSRTRLRGEIAALLRLATPVAVSQLALIGMSVTDVVVAGWAGTDQLAGMMLGTNLWTLVALFYLGIGLSAQPLIGHAFGAGKNRVIRRYFHNAIYAGFGLGALCALSVAGAAWGLLHLGYEPQLASVGSSYLAVMVFAAPAMSLLPVLRSTLEAMSQTARVTRVLVGAFLLNIPLDLLFVMGFGPFPGMGAAGCAIASTIVLWLTVYLLSLSLGARSGNRHLRLLQKFSRPDGAIMLHPEVPRLVDWLAGDEGAQPVGEMLGAPAVYARLVHPALDRRFLVASQADEAHVRVPCGDLLDIGEVIESDVADHSHARHRAQAIVRAGGNRTRKIHCQHAGIAAIHDGLELVDRVHDRPRRAVKTDATRVHLVKAERIRLCVQQLCERRRARSAGPETNDDHLAEPRAT